MVKISRIEQNQRKPRNFDPLKLTHYMVRACMVLTNNKHGPAAGYINVGVFSYRKVSDPTSVVLQKFN